MMRQAGVKTGSALRRSHRKMAACLGSEGESKAEEVVGRVCQGPALCVGGNSGFFFFFFSGKTASRSSWRPGERGRDGPEEG